MGAHHDSEYADALLGGAARGRGAQVNPGNRFEDVRLHVLGEHLDEVIAEAPDGSQVRTRVYADRTRRVINKVDSPDLGFNWTINPYRGCEHGCIYCYARPGHEMLGFSCGLDFETKIVAKVDAPALLRRELASPKWKGETIVMSGVTDPYQPVERQLCITRGVLEVMREFGQRVSLITKSALIVRDLDLLTSINARARAHCAISLTTLDNRLASTMEPRAASPRERLRAIEELTSAGIGVTVMTAPIIPGLNDKEIPDLLQAAKDAGATSAGYVMLRLPHRVKAVFLDWVRREFPDRASHVESLIRQTRSGALYDSAFGKRQRGEGPVASMVGRLFEVSAKRVGLWRDRKSRTKMEIPPQARLPAQKSLWDA